MTSTATPGTLSPSTVSFFGYINGGRDAFDLELADCVDYREVVSDVLDGRLPDLTFSHLAALYDRLGDDDLLDVDGPFFQGRRARAREIVRALLIERLTAA